MSWIEETRLTRRPLEEIGLATIVREHFHNRLEMSYSNAFEVLGLGWEQKAEALRKAGILRYERTGNKVSMSVIAPGDRKREQTKIAMRKNRNKKG